MYRYCPIDIDLFMDKESRIKKVWYLDYDVSITYPIANIIKLLCLKLNVYVFNFFLHRRIKKRLDMYIGFMDTGKLKGRVNWLPYMDIPPFISCSL